MTTADDRVRRAVDQHSALRESLFLKVLKALLGLWGGFHGWDDADLVSGHVARSTFLVESAMGQTRRLARSYGTSMLVQLDAAPKHPLPKLVELYPRSGSTTMDVHARPAEQYLWAISQGKTDAQALKIANARLRALVEMDVALAERDELEQMWAASPEVIGHRRIIHPERSVSGTCGLCVAAATRFYTHDELLPLHDRCKCTDAPIVKGNDPGLRLNKADLEEIYAEAGSTGAADLKRIRVTVKEHGELGPILVREGQNFRDVNEVNRDSATKKFNPYRKVTIEDQRKSWQAMRASSERSIQKLEAARDSGATTIDLTGGGKPTKVNDWAVAIKFHRDLIDRMNLKLR